MKFLGMIAARGGSKGVPRKNIAPVAGRPLIAWSIEAGLKSRLDRLIVSTEDAEIAAAARQYGAEVPFMRPVELAGDDSSSQDVCEHAFRWIEENWKLRFDYMIVLQPTSPFRNADDVNAVIQLLEETKAPAVTSLYEAPRHPYLMRKISPEGVMSDFFSQGEVSTRRQHYPDAYAINGAIFAASRESIMDLHTFFPPGTLAYVMPPDRSVDVDTPWDLRVAQLLMKDRMANNIAAPQS